MYKYLNNNALGKFENDCTIRSISCATGRSWDRVYEHLSDIAQAQGTMMDDRDFIIDYLDRRYERVPVYGETVGNVSEIYSDYIVLITMQGHITCSKYGVIYDSFDPRNRKAEYCWIIIRD